MTFTLVMVVYATAVTTPGHGNIAPLAIGFTLFASAFVGAPLPAGAQAHRLHRRAKHNAGRAGCMGMGSQLLSAREPRLQAGPSPAPR